MRKQTHSVTDTPPAQKNQSIYLMPTMLTANEANEKARPGETAQERQTRIEDLAESIVQVGQLQPVMAVEITNDDGVHYEYVGGGGRVDAIAYILNNPTKFPEGADQGLTVWCTLIDADSDLYRAAVTDNIHRTQNSVKEMMAIVREARERNGWKGRGAGAQVAAYLGLRRSRVSEYEKLLQAPEPVRLKIEGGAVDSLDAALKILALPVEAQVPVLDAAATIAREEAAREAIKTEVEPGEDVPDATPKGKKKAVKKGAKKLSGKVLSRHVDKAARKLGATRKSGKISPRGRADVVEFWEAISPAAYHKKAVAFADYYLTQWLTGKGTDAEARRLFDVATGGSGKPWTAKSVKVTKVVPTKSLKKATKAPAKRK